MLTASKGSLRKGPGKGTGSGKRNSLRAEAPRYHTNRWCFPHPGHPGTCPQAICFGSRSSHVTGMIAALDTRDRTGRRRSVLPRRSARDLGPRADPGWMLAGPNSLLSTTHSGPRGADAPGAPCLSDRESGKSAPLDIRLGRFRELKARDGEWGLPSPAMGSARNQGLSNRETPVPFGTDTNNPRRVDGLSVSRLWQCRWKCSR